MKYPFVCWHRSAGFLWVRLLGWGFLVKDTRQHRLLFSERMGLERFWRLGRYLVRGLVP